MPASRPTPPAIADARDAPHHRGSADGRRDAATLSSLVHLVPVGAALIGHFAFREVPDVPTIIGAGFTCAAGFILLCRRAARS